MPARPLNLAEAGAGIEELVAKALRPLTVDVCVDPVTLDRLFTLHFEEHAPMHIVVGPAELITILASISKAVARSLN